MKKKLKYILWVFFVLIVIIVFIVVKNFWQNNIGKKYIDILSSEKTDNKDAWAEFVAKFPNFSSIDVNKKICFDLWISITWSSIIDCFVPSEYSKHIQNTTDLWHYETLLSKAKVVEIVAVSEDRKNNFLKFYDYIQPHNIDGSTGNVAIYKDVRKELIDIIKSGDAVKDDWFNYAYIQSLEWNYNWFNNSRTTLCSKYKSFCEKENDVKLIISWKVFDNNDSPLEWAKIEILWYDNFAISDKDWNYSLNWTWIPIQRVRIMATKEWYNIWVYPFDILSVEKTQYKSKDFILTKADGVVNINTKIKTISWEWTDKNDKWFIVKTQRSEYFIPYNSIVTKSWDKYLWELNMYLFEFNKSSKINDLLENDIFDDIVWYAWNIMKTFWMPFVVFVSDKGEILHIFSDNPMILKSKIQEMEALKTNQDKIYQPLTDEDLSFLYDESNKQSWYIIDRFFLAKNNLFRFPAFWVFDQKRWIWDNIWVKLISKDGVIETIFYTILKD